MCRRLRAELGRSAPILRGVADGRFPVDRGIMLSDDDVQRRAIIKSIMCNNVGRSDAFGGGAAFKDELEALTALEADHRRGHRSQVS